MALAAAVVLMYPFPMEKGRRIEPAVVAETKVQVMTKKIYTELAKKLFDQANPAEIMAVSKTIAEECEATGLDPFFILAVIDTESNFHIEAVSGSGARGLMQIMPATFKDVSTSRRMFDPVENVKAGIRYFALLKSQGFKTKEYLLSAYNQGPGAAILVAQGKLEMSSETRKYIPKVINKHKEFLVAQK